MDNIGNERSAWSQFNLTRSNSIYHSDITSFKDYISKPSFLWKNNSLVHNRQLCNFRRQSFKPSLNETGIEFTKMILNGHPNPNFIIRSISSRIKINFK